MKNLIILLISTVLFAGLTAFTNKKINIENDEAAVWQLEENYWKYVEDNDLDSYRDLWDDRFIGWPGFSPNPLAKENITAWIPALHSNPKEIYGAEIQKKSVRIHGDVAAVHYLVTHFFRDAVTGEKIKSEKPFRITHTWKRKGDTWQIITGMSASYEH